MNSYSGDVVKLPNRPASGLPTPSLAEAAERLAYLREHGVEPEGEFRKIARRVPVLPEVRRDISRYRGHEALGLLCAPQMRGVHEIPWMAAHLRARLARELAVAGGGVEAKAPNAQHVQALVRRASTLQDPAGMNADGSPRTEVLSRFSAFQFMLQADVAKSIPRIFGSLRSDDPDSPISDEFWETTLGMPLPEYLLATIAAASELHSHGLICREVYDGWLQSG